MHLAISKTRDSLLRPSNYFCHEALRCLVVPAYYMGLQPLETSRGEVSMNESYEISWTKNANKETDTAFFMFDEGDRYLKMLVKFYFM
jgi:hypothetical protein